jgi:hypothetical protein
MNLEERNAEAVVVIGRPSEATAAFGQPRTTNGTSMEVPLILTAGGVAARTTIELAGWSGGLTRLVDYFDELAHAWQGWAGVKDWADDGPNVSMSATHDTVGLVKLSISAAPFAGWIGPGSWELRVVVPIEPGSLVAVAEGIRLLLGIKR